MVLSTLFAVCPTALARADLIVDGFTTPQNVNNSGGFGNSTPDGLVFGGARVLNLQVTNSSQVFIVNNVTHLLTLNVTPSSTSFVNSMTLSYVDATPSEDLAVINVTDLSFANLSATGDWTLKATFNGTSAPNTVISTTAISNGFSGNLVVPFSSFKTVGNVFTSPAVLGNISSMSFEFSNSNGTAPQLTFGPITLTTTAVPEPALLGLGSTGVVGALASLRRRRKK
jgi:hypothetical protein